MTEQELADALVEVFNTIAGAQDTDAEDQDATQFELDEQLSEPIIGATTFEEALVLTRNAGVVLRLKDGSEFQIAIVQSRGVRPVKERSRKA